MTRVLRRPMFRMGGNTDQGIMSGVAPRQGYKAGKTVEDYKRILGEAAGRRPDTSMANLLIDFGLNVASAEPRGSIFSTAAGAAKEPFQRYQASKADRAAFDQKLGLSAATMALEHEQARKLKMMGDHTYVQETIVDAVENGFKVKEIPSIWLERKAGLSKVVRSKIHYIINVFPILFIRCNLHKIIFYPLSAFLFFLSIIFFLFYNTVPDIVFPLLLLNFSFLLIFFGYCIEQYKNLIFYLRGLKK